MSSKYVCYSHMLGHWDLEIKKCSCRANNSKVESQSQSLGYESYFLSTVLRMPLKQ